MTLPGCSFSPIPYPFLVEFYFGTHSGCIFFMQLQLQFQVFKDKSFQPKQNFLQDIFPKIYFFSHINVFLAVVFHIFASSVVCLFQNRACFNWSFFSEIDKKDQFFNFLFLQVRLSQNWTQEDRWLKIQIHWELKRIRI